jgi:hypothetical protein
MALFFDYLLRTGYYITEILSDDLCCRMAIGNKPCLTLS